MFLANEILFRKLEEENGWRPKPILQRPVIASTEAIGTTAVNGTTVNGTTVNGTTVNRTTVNGSTVDFLKSFIQRSVNSHASVSATELALASIGTFMAAALISVGSSFGVFFLFNKKLNQSNIINCARVDELSDFLLKMGSLAVKNEAYISNVNNNATIEKSVKSDIALDVFQPLNKVVSVIKDESHYTIQLEDV
jgi:hypothetical protein